jgi:hypothetical protein
LAIEPEASHSPWPIANLADCASHLNPPLQFDVSMKDLPGFRADAVLGDSIFEALIEPRDVRRLRDSVINLAHFVSRNPQRRGISLGKFFFPLNC